MELVAIALVGLAGVVAWTLSKLPQPTAQDDLSDAIWLEAGFQPDRSEWVRGAVRARQSPEGWRLSMPVPEGVSMGTQGAHRVADGVALFVDEPIQLGWWSLEALGLARTLDAHQARIGGGQLLVAPPAQNVRALVDAVEALAAHLSHPPTLDELEARCRENGPVRQAAAEALQELAPERLAAMVDHPDANVRLMAATAAGDWPTVIATAGPHRVEAATYQRATTALLAACDHDPSLASALLGAPHAVGLRAEGALRTGRLDALPTLSSLDGQRDLVMRVLDRFVDEGRNLAAEVAGITMTPWWLEVLATWALRHGRLDVLPPLHQLRGQRELVREALDLLAETVGMDRALEHAFLSDPWWAMRLLEQPPDETRMVLLRSVADDAAADPQAHAVVARFLERWGASEDVTRLQALKVSDMEERVANLKQRLVGSAGAVSIVQASQGELSLAEEPSRADRARREPPQRE